MNLTNGIHVRIIGPAAMLLLAFGSVFAVRTGVQPVPSAMTDTTDTKLVSHRPADDPDTKIEAAVGNHSPRYLGKPNPLPLPSGMSVPAFEEMLFEFLNERKYATELKWLKDKVVRDTGPYIQGKYYGTHPAVRVFYSPGIIKWLQNGRKGSIPDGEMIIKEQYPPPAVRHHGKSETELYESLESWTIMIKDSAGSQDGWFWGNPAKGQCVVDNHQFPFDHPLTGFGHYCVRCHASTQSPDMVAPGHKANEFTFSSLRNIEGFPGEPIIFRVDDSWRTELKDLERLADNAENEDKLVALIESTDHDSHPKCTQTDPPARIPKVLSQVFLDHYSSIEHRQKEDVLHLPPVTHDWVAKDPSKDHTMVTSNQCMSCHAGLVEPFGPSMFVGHKPGENGYGADGWHISPYGEWRWTPMGLAGRDPVFYAQMESELAILKKEFEPELAETISKNLVDTCLRCHGAMGKHQFDRHKEHPDQKFTLQHVYLKAGEDEHIGTGKSHYGALARDGISCVVCHKAQPRPQPEDDERHYLQYFLETSITGNFHLSEKPEIYGPYKDDEIAPYAMEHSIGLKPKYSEYISSSRMCGSCHVVNLPTVDEPFNGDQALMDYQADLIAAENVPVFKKFKHHVEQATYLEWLNSEFENEFNKSNPNAKSCQDCHMASHLKDERHDIDLAKIETRIAAIQDATYPDGENLTSHENLNVRVREQGYNRHNFVGLNVFLVELARQFDEVLGVRKHDFMTGSRVDVENAIENYRMTARRETADVSVQARVQGNKLVADVLVESKVGHRFPSGVGFRRAFLEFLVIEKEGTDRERIVWSSGRTNSLGVILGPAGEPLPTESFDRDEDGKEQYQPHHQVINSQEQVQIYETLLWNAKDEFTTSFIHGCKTVKDNRFLPRGWTREGPDPEALTGNFLRATMPGRVAAKDPQYQDGSGTDSTRYEVELPAGVDPDKVTVRASLYYQAMPPYFLRNLFENAPDGPATTRLHYMLSHIKLDDTIIKDWKLLVNTAEQKLQQ